MGDTMKIIYMDNGMVHDIPINELIEVAMLKIPYWCLFEIVESDITDEELNNIIERWNKCQH